MVVTYKDIAKHLGVSEATVSLALNNSPLVKKETREKVLKATEELNYTPNLIARSLATNKSNSIGIIIPDMNIAYYASVLKELDRIVKEHGYSLVMAMSNNDPKMEAQCVQNFISKRIEGVLVVPTNKPTKYLDDYRKNLERYDIPIVYITSLYEIDNIKYVMGDVETGTYMLINHLVDLGHSNIAYVGGNHEIPVVKRRVKGYKEALKQSNLLFNEELIVETENMQYADAVQATEQLIGRNVPFTAVAAVNDEMALGVLNTLLSNGLKVPEDVSVVGYDNTTYSQVSVPEITTMDSHISYTYRKAVDMLLKTINKEKVEDTHIETIPSLVKRGSTDRANI